MFLFRLWAIALIVITPFICRAQCKTDLAGVWEITASKRSYSGTATFYDKRSGEFQNLTSGATTKIYNGLCPTDREDMAFFVAGAFGAGDMLYIGKTISSDGNSILGGTVGISRSQTTAEWTAKRIAGNGPPKITAVVNAATGNEGLVVPGELISLYSNANLNALGPSVGIGLQINDQGKVSDSIGGVMVEFLPIGVFAPLTYASAGQINAVVPYEVAGLSQAQLKVHFNGRSSDAFTVRVGTTAPGIFTANGSGTGSGAIVNHDGRINSVEHREPRGGIVVLYATGAGQTSPPGVSGRVTVALNSEPYTPQPLAPAIVHIGGVPARVLFYGEAPGIISGVVQLNVEIPVAISPGTVPVSITVGNNTSREGVTVAVE